MFEAQVVAQPQAVAIVQGEEQLTYEQLNARANQLAHYLRSQGLAAETLVPVCLPRTPQLLVALLGILKAGAAYVPLAASYPPARLRYLLLDTQARVVISSQDTAAALAGAGVAQLQLVELDGPAAALISQQPTHNPAVSVTARHLAYVLYTSGSTGQPKGVLVEHGNVVSLVHEVDYVALTPETVVLATGSPAFDATTFEYWGPLLNGGQLVLAGEHQLLNSQWLAEEIQRRQVTTMWFTASWCNQLIDTAPAVFRGLRTVLVGGEALSPPHMQRLQRAYPALEIINGYGPTENTTFSLTHRLTAADLTGAPIPLGRPLPHRYAYVLDAAQQPVAPGAEGEIYVGGAGVARGYLGQEALTQATFGPDLLSPTAGARWYRTGDRGRWRPDGLLEYLGRRDEQVKLRGFRIELAEIEAALNALAPVSSSCVVARQEGNTTNRLVSYYVPDGGVVKAKERELYYRQIASWKELYETEYAKTEGTDAVDQEFNIIGWNDSFTGEPIPAAQMQAWLHDITAVILAERPEYVLEIGCGTGLIYYQLAGKVKKYIGTDFSRSCINQIAHTISQGRRDYGPTELLVGAAHELALREGEPVDTIILNSIIQYFPGEDYLTSVIEKGLALLNGQGRLIIGDVRDNRLLPLFKGRLQAPKLADSLTAKEFDWAVEQEVLKEEELCFSPEYFYRLQARYPQITHVEIQWKQGDYINELTLYRYTVLLHVGEKTELVVPAWQKWSKALANKDFIAQLVQGQPTVALQDVPNPRLREERRLALALQDKSDKPLAAVLDTLEGTDADSAAAEEVLRVALEQGYHCRLFLDEDPLLVNVLLERQPTTSFIQQIYSEKELSNRPATNISLFADISALLQKELRTLLKQRLPEYMVPTEFIALSHLPLTGNGKVDRRFLSQREDRGVATKFNYEAPRNEAERQLATIWQELLGVEQVGIHDNFFELGGHSLLATRVVSAVRKGLAVEMVIKDLFVHPTIAELAEHLPAQAKGEALPTLSRQPLPERIPLSFSQERLWFIDQLEGSVQYHVPVVLRLKGQVNRPALAAALRTILQRHEVLRTVLRAHDGQAYQQVLPHDDWQLGVLDGCVYIADPEAVQLQVQQLITQPFDLSRDPMLRATLLKLAEQEHLLVITLHHIASDGWSLSILFRELVALYEAHTEGRAVHLAPLPVQYADFAVWQRQHLRGPRLAQQLAYWKEKLHGVAHLQLPTDYPRPAVQSTQGASAGFRLNKELIDKLQVLSQQQGVTLFMTLLATFKSLLYRYSGQPDICVGSAIAGRQQHEIEDLIGFFVNTLALRSQVRGEASFTELLQQVRATTLEAYEHQQAPFEKVVDAVVKERDLSRSPLFQVLFVLQNTPDIPDLSLGEVQATRESYAHSTAQFDFTFTLTEDELGLQGFVEYSTDLYQAPTVARLIGHFTELLHAVVKQPQQAIDALPLLTPAEEHQLLTEISVGPQLAAPTKTFVTLFEEQAAAQPQARAVVCGHETMTYGQLNAQANQLAHYLLSLGPPPPLVPVCLPRTPQLLVALLGILKAGAAYVPLDPDYPAERLRYMLQDATAPLALTSRALSTRLQEVATPALRLVEIDGAEAAAIAQQPTTNLPPQSRLQDLAYVIYTSGSTGTPKGVMIEHGSAATFIQWCQQEFAATPFEIVYAGTSVCFDLSIFEIFYPLSVGKPLRLLENGLEIGQYVAQDTNILLNSVPSVINSLLKEGIDKTNVTAINMAGEPIPLQVQQGLDPDKMEVRNLYGPTEDTTYSTLYRLQKGVPALIGKPIGNTVAYVMSKGGQLNPLGVAGEICLGGDGLARGYRNRPELTAEKFIPNPFSSVPGARLYRTGDLGRWLADGNLEYLGRLDDQVKVRGYRIELGEIESVLQQSALVKHAVVLAKADQEGTRRLVGYVVPTGAFDRDALANYLRNRLPEYMVPPLWVELTALPLTPNGKIDKKALPEPEASLLLGNEYVAPRTAIEQALATIWQEVLGVGKAGVNGNFFELGGDSISTIQVVSRARKAGYSLQPKDLFTHQTIAKLAQAVAARQETSTVDKPTEKRIVKLNGKEGSMVALQKEGAYPPFFAIPGFLLYRHLAAHMGHNQPFYGFELPAYEQLEEVAAEFIHEMKQVQPHGPYFLGAFCGDYPIIFEVAQQLLDQGEKVPVVALFEAYPPVAFLSKKSSQYLKQKIRIYHDQIRKKTVSETVKFIGEEAVIKLKFIARKIAGVANEQKVIRDYPGKVVLFKSSVPTPGLIDDPLGGWSEHVTGAIEVLTVSGDHITIFKEPGVQELAKKLSSVLEKARS
ncbi:non-ribosomal peptide synthetase [Hymenobacter ginkgonis]|uniref:non-ribosomal peptide synthetase n=1 Tax=Hymenobacter ginkgonis TaxID=2682976 RepID=UPI0018DD634D|nr:non-ribosomal peptide synthetase [Hymenobacter ginkgonis]